MTGPEIRLEKTRTGWSAWSPDLRGCIATGATEEEARERMAAAVAMHTEALRKGASGASPGGG